VKQLKDRLAILSDNPGLFEAVVVLEPETGWARPILYQGHMEVAERFMSAWNAQIGIETKHIRAPAQKG
jgi:hypothetical protein